jgi:hypothetical protein
VSDENGAALLAVAGYMGGLDVKRLADLIGDEVAGEFRRNDGTMPSVLVDMIRSAARLATVKTLERYAEGLNLALDVG